MFATSAEFGPNQYQDQNRRRGCLRTQQLPTGSSSVFRASYSALFSEERSHSSDKDDSGGKTPAPYLWPDHYNLENPLLLYLHFQGSGYASPPPIGLQYQGSYLLGFSCWGLRRLK